MRPTPLLRNCLLAACAASCGTAAAVDWLQWGYDAAHTGNNLDEATITTANVSQLTRRYNVALQAQVDSAPVYARAVVTASGTRDLLFMSWRYGGGIMALDAQDGSVVWSKPADATQRQSHASPVIDPDRQFVYSYDVTGYVRKFAIGDGSEVLTGGWPQLVTLKPNVEKGASALAIAMTAGKKYLYAVTDGYIGDAGDYQGHLTTIDLGSGTQTVFNTLCSDKTIHLVAPAVTNCASRQSGIWGRAGASFDSATGRVYITTGNGNFNANTGGLNWGDSLLALNPDGTGAGGGLPLDSYTPTTYPDLDSQDIDLGSASLLVLQPPAGSAVQHVGVQTGKDSKLHLIDLDNMNGSGAPGGVGGAIEVIDVPISQFWAKTQPVSWVDTQGDGASWIYMANGSGISGLKLTLNATNNKPHLQPTWQASSTATSAIVANGIVYHAGSCAGGTCMLARDPHNGSVLWTSPTIGSLHWQSPILANGALYIAAGSNLHRFDLGVAPTTHVVTPAADAHGRIVPATAQLVDDGASAPFTLVPDAGYAIGGASGCGGQLVGAIYRTGPITGDCMISASFVAIHTVTPIANAHGAIDPSTPQAVVEGATTSFTLTPDAHYRIDAASGCGGGLQGQVFTTSTVTADCTVTASFAPITHTVTPQAGAGGTIAPDLPQTVDEGSSTSFTLMPDAGHVIQQASGCSGTLVGAIFTTATIASDCTVSATFVVDPDLIFRNGFDAVTH